MILISIKNITDIKCNIRNSQKIKSDRITTIKRLWKKRGDRPNNFQMRWVRILHVSQKNAIGEENGGETP